MKLILDKSPCQVEGAHCPLDEIWAYYNNNDYGHAVARRKLG